MEKVICDTDVMIDYLNKKHVRHTDTVNVINQIGLDNVVLSAITKMELIAGVKDKSEFFALKKNIGFFDILLINKPIALLAIQLMEIYKLSHGLEIADAFIAATALFEDHELYTYNTRDYKFIANLKLYKY